MLMNKWVFLLVTILLMVVSYVLLDNMIIAGVIALIIVLVWYIQVALKRNQKRLALLDDACDPEAFIKMTEEHSKSAKNNLKVKYFLRIDHAAGLIHLGRFEEARDLLMQVDKFYLSQKRGVKLIYHINMVSALLGLNALEEAVEMYKEEVETYTAENAYINRLLSNLKAELLFHQGELDQAKEILIELLEESLSNKDRLNALYYLAQIHEKQGHLLEAAGQFKIVSEDGPKLWIGSEALKHMKQIENRQL